MLKIDVDTRPKIRYLELVTHRLVNTNFIGDYPSVFKGRGIIFESYREYSPSSDDASEIDWKASIKCGKTMVKEYVEERNLDVFFLVDASYTMVFGSQKKLKHEYAAEMVASMAFAILDKGDAVGLGLFSDTLRCFLPPERGHSQYRRILYELTRPQNYDGPCDFEGAIRMCLRRLKPQTLILLITDCIDMDGNWKIPLKIANKKFELAVMVVRDPRDDELPDGVEQVAIENPINGEQMLISVPAIKESYAKEAKRLLSEHISLFTESGIIDVPIFRTDGDFTKKIISFFEKRKRRMR